MKYGIANRSGQPSYEEVLGIIAHAAENDIWYYDTAQSYGNSESILGQAFRDLSLTSDVRCISKLQPSVENDAGQVLESVRDSVAKLGVPKLWALMAHRVDQVDNPEIRKAVANLKLEELIKYWGVSIYKPSDALEMVGNDDIDVLQVPFNILDRRLTDVNFFDRARSHRKTVFIRSVFLQGLLFLTPEEIKQKGMDWAVPYIEDVRERLDRINSSIKEFAIGAVSKYTGDAIIVLGIEKLSQLKENIALVSDLQISEKQARSWWRAVPSIPERLLNPSLW